MRREFWSLGGSGLDELTLSALRHGRPRKALEHYEHNGAAFEFVVKATMAALGRGDESVSEWKPVVLRAIERLAEGEE